jgi:hypothetical protein
MALSRLVARLIVLGLVAGLFFWVFGEVIFRDRNFIYRDAGHFYYPLLKLVQDEWNAGRWPLWNPQENAGMPLLGNPASAALYPPRIVLFQWLPISYGTAYKWYIMLHVIWSAATAYGMARHWRASEFAAGLAAMSYAFGAIVMFQYCNVIFLVGASWVPLGLVAADRALSAGNVRWAVALGLVLALQMFGGDPEAAYVTGGLAALYVALLDPPWAVGLGAMFGLAAALKGRQEAVHLLGLTALVAPWLIRLGRAPAAQTSHALRRRRTAALLWAGAVAAGVSAVQWLPSWEFGRLSARASPNSNHEPYAFWIAPWRLAESLWPNCTGYQFPQHTRWIEIFNFGDGIWEPSLYLGVLPLLLALFGWGVRRVPHWQRWLSLTLLLSLWAATGPAGGVSWYLRGRNERSQRGADSPGAVAQAAPAPAPTPGRRFRDELEYPAGGLYWFMVEALPGFRTFRYPAKLLTFAAAALAALAAVGWDRLVQRCTARQLRILAGLAATSVLFALILFAARPVVVAALRSDNFASAYYGPLQVSAGLGEVISKACTHFVETRGTWQVPDAFWGTAWAPLHTALVLAGVLAVLAWSRRQVSGPLWPAVLLALVAVDIGLANRWLLATAPQADLERTPNVVEILREAETSNPASGPNTAPFRIHRASIWSPLYWIPNASDDRDKEIFRWEKDTVQPKHGVPYGIHYTINEGTMEPYDYWFFFAPFYRRVPARMRADAARLPERVVYYPRRGYDMWGVKYFVLPRLPDWDQEHRGFIAFLPNTEPVSSSSPEQDDFQVLRNLNCYPRAWIVHRMLWRKPIRGMWRIDRQEPMEEMLYEGDEFWFDPDRERTKQDPRQVAWVEVPADQRDQVESYQAPAAASAADHCEFVRYEPLRVELVARTAARGLLVVAEPFLPGWRLTVDGQPRRILRTNRMMRGVLLEPGEHRVVFEYKPLTFRLGGVISLATFAGLFVSGLANFARRFHTASA